jgi:hypothetical protein
MKDDIFRRHLKKAGSRAIEDALTKAICELAGEEYEVDIRSIDFGTDGLSATTDKVTITLTASRPLKWPSDERPVSDETAASPA